MRKLFMVLAIFTISLSSQARVGDESCEKWSIYEETKMVGEYEGRRNGSVLNHWNCTEPSGNNRQFHCRRQVQVCIQWGPSPSQELANKIGTQIGSKVAESLTNVNTNMHENYSADVFSMINELGAQIDNLAKALIQIINNRN